MTTDWDDLGQGNDPNRSTLPVLWRAPETGVAVHKPRAKRITPEQEDKIIELRLRGLSVREVRERTGHAKDTITSVYRRYLDSVAEERHGDLERYRAEAVTRLERAVATSWDAWIASCTSEGGPRAAILAEYRQSIGALVRLTGAEHASQVEVNVSGKVDVQVDVSSMSDSQLRDLLAAGGA